jgi:hypothetical protein
VWISCFLASWDRRKRTRMKTAKKISAVLVVYVTNYYVSVERYCLRVMIRLFFISVTKNVKIITIQSKSIMCWDITNLNMHLKLVYV